MSATDLEHSNDGDDDDDVSKVVHCGIVLWSRNRHRKKHLTDIPIFIIVVPTQ